MKRSRLGAVLALAALVSIVLHNTRIAALQLQPLSPVPSDAAVAESVKLIREVYKDDYAKKRPVELIEFARKLLTTAAETKDDATARYAMYREARDVAIRAGDVPFALDIAVTIARSYAVDPADAKYAALEVATKSTTCPNGPILEAAFELTGAAIQVDDYVRAAKFLKLAATRGTATNIDARKKQLEEIRKEYEKLEPDRASLRTNPDDSTAAGRVGRFLCLRKGDWDAGLLLLAKGDDEKLRGAAERELARPGTADERIALADAWWDLSEKLEPGERIEAKARSLYWYRSVSAGLTGLTKARVDKRVTELNKLVANRIVIAAKEWKVLFRSANPSLWNTDTGRGKESFAESLAGVAAGVRYLRLKNVETGKAVIMELPKELPKEGLAARFEYNGFGWNGTKELSWKSHHLGIYDMERRTKKGDVAIYDNVGRATYPGWGFGHVYDFNDRQGFTWDGVTLKETAFEIAVKSTNLTSEEMKLLLKSKK